MLSLVPFAVTELAGTFWIIPVGPAAQGMGREEQVPWGVF